MIFDVFPILSLLVLQTVVLLGTDGEEFSVLRFGFALTNFFFRCVSGHGIPLRVIETCGENRIFIVMAGGSFRRCEDPI